MRAQSGLVPRSAGVERDPSTRKLQEQLDEWEIEITRLKSEGYSRTLASFQMAEERAAFIAG